MSSVGIVRLLRPLRSVGIVVGPVRANIDVMVGSFLVLSTRGFDLSLWYRSRSY